MAKGRFNLKTILKIALFCLGVLLLLVLIKNTGLGEIIKIVGGAKIIFLFFGVFVYLLLIITRAFKWFLLIKTKDEVLKFREFIPFYFINCLIGNITPFKSGETGTPIFLEKYLKIPVGRGLSVVILDRFVELAIFSLILFSALIYIIKTGAVGGFILPIFWWIIFGLLLLTAIFSIIIFSKKITFRILDVFKYFKRYPLIKKFWDFAEKELYFFYESLALFKEKKVYRFLIPLTLMSWFLELLSFYLVMHAVLPAPFLNIAAAQLVAIAATLLTFIPVGLGVGEWGVVYVLTHFNYPTALSASGVLLTRLFLTGTLLSIGLLGTFLLKGKKQ